MDYRYLVRNFPSSPASKVDDPGLENQALENYLSRMNEEHWELFDIAPRAAGLPDRLIFRRSTSWENGLMERSGL